ncbi:hypothetical protein MsAm2_04400 [Methanolapillus ohkumae]|uniref:Rad51-like C-terminal domain-containing protein n=1 Tax=Methanolapillus ohkumae TaxID=3028298 RepID=A0AA96V5T5_9EURY|nr:hypothetical protein MsAm2_04400 [Methanosarcinaceae archaeon Am2]
MNRFSQIAGERSKEIAQNILIYEPMSFDEQYTAICEIEKILGENIGLIVVDSATSFYRFELDDELSGIQSRRELSNQIGFLQGMARKSGVAVLITNQIFSDVSRGENGSSYGNSNISNGRNNSSNGSSNVRPIGGKAIEHISKTILQLEKTGAGTRIAKIIKHRCRPEGEICEFTITAEGLR